MAKAEAKEVLSQILIPFAYFQPSSFAVAVQIPPHKSRTADGSLALLSYLPFILQKPSVALGSFVTKQ